MDIAFVISGGQWIGVAIGAVLYMVLSMVWYMPRVFGNQWMEGEGLKEEDLRANESPAIYVITFVMALVSNIVIAAASEQHRRRSGERAGFRFAGGSRCDGDVDCSALHVR